MKTLLIMRHAKSSWDDPDLADHDRPLNGRGRRDAPAMGEKLAQAGLRPDLILASDAVRTVQTAQAVSGPCGYSGRLERLNSLYAAPPSAYLQALAGLQDDVDTVLVVGHNPGLEELIQQICGEAQAMPTGAVAQVALPVEHWSELSGRKSGRLIRVWKPKS